MIANGFFAVAFSVGLTNLTFLWAVLIIYGHKIRVAYFFESGYN